MAENQKDPKPPAAKEPAPRPQAKEAKPRHLKISRMSLRDIEQALEGAQRHMGGLHSQYARALLARKEFLTQSTAFVKEKAA